VLKESPDGLLSASSLQAGSILWCNHENNHQLTENRQKRVEELEKKLKSMEEQLQRANQSTAVVRVVDDREALENLWEEGLSNFEHRIHLEGSDIMEVRNTRSCSPS
jgi:PP-loop superfamily ATP-utilizing enzyme